MKRDTSDPAFPRALSEDRRDGDQPDGNRSIPQQDGMSYRRWLIGESLRGLLSSPIDSVNGPAVLIYWHASRGPTWNRNDIPARLAALACELADAVLSELAKET